MGEMAEAMLNGEFCQGCGEFLGDGDGYPTFCRGCRKTERPERETRPMVGDDLLRFVCGGHKLAARFKAIVQASTLVKPTRWEDAPKQHNKLFGRGLITKDKQGRAWASSRGMQEFRNAYGE